MQILYFMSLFCLETTSLALICTINVPSLSVLQSFMSLGRHSWQSSRQRPTFFALDSSGMDRTACSFDIYMYVGNQVLPLAFSFRLWPAFQCTWKDGEEEAVLMDYQWAVFYLLRPQTSHRHPPSLSLPPFSGLSCTISPLITGIQFTDIGTLFHTDKLQW